MGVAPLLGWRKTSPGLFINSFLWPLVVTATMVLLHFAVGKAVLFPPFVEVDPLSTTPPLGRVLAWTAGTYPLITVALSAFNVAVVVQEFARGIRARQRTNKGENAFASLFHLWQSRPLRRAATSCTWASRSCSWASRGAPGASTGGEPPARRVDRDRRTSSPTSGRAWRSTRRSAWSSPTSTWSAKAYPWAEVSARKDIYKASQDAPATKVGFYHTAKNDLYVVLGMANPQSKIASFQIHVNHLISFVWLGTIILIFGAIIAMWPDIALREAGAFSYVRAAGAVGTAGIFRVAPGKAELAGVCSTGPGPPREARRHRPPSRHAEHRSAPSSP